MHSREATIWPDFLKDVSPLQMPPQETGHKLSPEEIESLKRWIAAGAHYAPHWSYTRPERPCPLKSSANELWLVATMDATPDVG